MSNTTLKFGSLLGSESDCWEVPGPDGGLVAFLDAQGRVARAIAFRAGEPIEAQLAAFTGAEAAVKAIVGEAAAPKLEAAIKARGWRVEKIVVRTGAFVARFLPREGRLLVAAAPARTRVLIVDDSPTIRKLLEHILGSDPGIEVVGSVGLPSEVEGAITSLRPDVITLDIHLPEMNGVDLLKRYLPRHPIPTVMISSISMEEGPLVLAALEAGAVDYIQKPGAKEVDAVSALIQSKVREARGARVITQAKKSPRAALPPGKMGLQRIIAIGSSTGGTEALREVLERLPAEIPPIVVVQHIPAVFSKAFAERLHSLCPFTVTEGVDGEKVAPGKVIIAPGGKQMRVERQGLGYVVRIDDSPPVNRHRPSVDFLFDSVASVIGADAIGVILTGMGADGARGLLAMKKAGSPTVGQNQETCVVYGMPQAAFKLGAVDQQLPLEDIAQALVQLSRAPVGAKSA